MRKVIKCKIQTKHNFFSPSTETNQKESLQCYTCYVTTSWEDCNKNSTIKRCPEGDNEVCVTMKVDKWNKNNEPITEYVKYCSSASYCSDKECKDYGYKCTIQCCDEDLCNLANTGVSNGPIQLKSARKIWLLLELLANITLVLACSCSQN